jgi:4-deoxy-L-threo-5-hexosulose-uronate ketol-isomerase
MTTAEVRQNFLISGLFHPGRIQMVYTDLDRMIIGGIMPGPEVSLPAYPELRSAYFTERREVGIINLGDAGEIAIGSLVFPLEHLECLYISQGERDIVFRNSPGGQAAFYLLSAPAHRNFQTTRATLADASVQELGTAERASKRKLVQYIHEGGIESCQLVMGYTKLEPGSVWNTWPPHTHLRRSEVYLYFELGVQTVMHFLGEPEASRHVVVRDREAVLSPSWSIHTGVGTGAYSFVWGMAGENRSFADMDPVELAKFA